MSTRLNLFRRGLAFAGECDRKYGQQINSKKPEDAEKFLRHIAARFQSPGAIILLVATLLSFVVVLCGVEYSIRHVATRLAIVEHTSTSSSGRIALTDEPDAPLYKAPLIEDIDGEEKLALPDQSLALPSKPITARLRTTMQFLHSQEGFRSRFRGLRFGIFYLVFMGMFSILFETFFAALMGPMGLWLGSTTAALVCCNAHATWTHAVIAARSDKPFFQQFLPVSVAKKLVLPTLRLHVQLGFMHYAVMRTAHAAGRHMSRTEKPSFLMVLPIVLAFVMGFGAVLPSYIALVRIEASLLPEDSTAIVPFDRTFGGRMDKLSPSATSKCRFAKLRNISLRGAFMTFDRDTYKRTVKMLVKFVAISTAFYFAFVALLLAEVYMIIGGAHNVRKLLDIADAAFRGDL